MFTLFVHGTLTDSNEETLLQELKTCFFGSICMAIFVAGPNILANMLPVAKYLTISIMEFLFIIHYI